MEVVPLETREWKPLMAPQAMVTKSIGKRLPTPAGTSWFTAGAAMRGCPMKMAR